MAAFKSIIIVGAGPSGLLLANLLAGLENPPSITVIDAAPSRNRSPRATHYGPPAIRILRRAGILEPVRREGYMPMKICWRKLDGTRLAGLDRTLLHDDGLDGDGLTMLPVEQLCGILEDELCTRGVSVQWGSQVVALGGMSEGERSAWVEVEENSQLKRYEADFVIGTDGGNSTVRRLVFGKRNFPGFSWEEQVVATNTQYDFDQFGWEDTNFIIHPEHWYMAARIGPHPDPKKNVWRISYGELPGLSAEELMERQPMKFEKMLPGHPKPSQYKVLNKSPYKVHQRCVEKMRIGRVMLAADAAHLCNPFGGMGLTGGIVDIGGLFDCLAGLYTNAADDSILDIWAQVQRQKYFDIVNPVSSGNIRRLFAQDPERAMEEDQFLQDAKRSESDIEFSRELQSSSLELLHDYTQYYRKDNVGSPTVNEARSKQGFRHEAVATSKL